MTCVVICKYLNEIMSNTFYRKLKILKNKKKIQNTNNEEV